MNICLSDIPRSEVREGKDGKKYVDLLVGERKTPDQRGNDHWVKISVPKERRDEPPIYVGSGRSITPRQDRPAYGAGPKMDLSGKIDKDDLPWD